MQIEIEAEDYCRPTCPDLEIARYIQGDARGGMTALFYCRNEKKCRRIAEEVRRTCAAVSGGKETLIQTKTKGEK